MDGKCNHAIDTAPEGTQNEQIVSESIKSAKEKKFLKLIHIKQKF